MTPDPGCLFLTAQHREAFAGLAYTILNRRGFGVLTGDAGTGKTTLVAKVLTSLPKDKVQTSILFHPTLSSNDFLELVMLDFGMEDIPASKAQRLTRLQSFLIESHQEGKISTLIVDEAHKLSMRLLEEVRLLGNFDYTDQKLLQILLVGQTELDDILALDQMRQLKQRVAIRLRIQRIASSEVEAYIKYRWLKAGGTEPVPFSHDAIESIAEGTKGLPRVINAVCDNALLIAFAGESRSVELTHVRQSMADLKVSVRPQLQTETTPPAPVEETAESANGPAVNGPISKSVTAANSLTWARGNDGKRAEITTVPSPIRVPEYTPGNRQSFLARLAGKLMGTI
jgi:general secretion pathway protein A